MSELAKCESCMCMNLRKASRAITQLYDREQRHTRLRATQFTILVAVARSDMLTISTLAKFLVMDRTTLTRNLKPLERQALLTVESGTDRRARHLKITKTGIEKLKVALPYWQKAQQKVVGELGADKFHLMMQELSEIVEINQK